jgi:hypothetical protein
MVTFGNSLRAIDYLAFQTVNLIIITYTNTNSMELLQFVRWLVIPGETGLTIHALCRQEQGGIENEEYPRTGVCHMI